VNTLRVPSLNVERARALAKSPELRLLRRLLIEREVYQEAGTYKAGPDIPAHTYQFHPSMYALANSQHFGDLRVFQLGEHMEGEYSNCFTSGETAVELVANMPQLEELYLLGHSVDTQRLFRLKSLKNLRVLQIYRSHRYPLQRLADNPAFSNLTQMFFHPHAMERGDDGDGAYINLSGVRAVLRSKHLKKITHLQLRLSDMGDEGCEEIIRSGALARLKLLDLMHGRVTDEGARVLAGCPELRNLDLLEISNNRLTRAGVKVLKDTGIKVRALDQRQPDIDDTEYLYAGDIE
jgi:hypothetical protein